MRSLTPSFIHVYFLKIILALCPARLISSSSLAFFSENSTMMSLPGATLAGGVVTFETAGIKKLSCDLDIGGHSVVNLKVSGGTLDGIASVSTSELFLSDAAAAVSAVGHSIIATLGPKGRLETSSLAFDSANKVFFPGNVGGHAWAGSVDAKGQMLKNPMIVGGSLSKMAEGATSTLSSPFGT